MLWLIWRPEPAASIPWICYGSLEGPYRKKVWSRSSRLRRPSNASPLDAIYSSPRGVKLSRSGRTLRDRRFPILCKKIVECLG